MRQSEMKRVATNAVKNTPIGIRAPVAPGSNVSLTRFEDGTFEVYVGRPIHCPNKKEAISTIIDGLNYRL